MDFQLNDDLKITLKEDATGDDLITLRDLGFDPVFNPDITASSLMECHYDKTKMLDLINAISDKRIDSIEKGVSGKQIFEAIQSFFVQFGLRFK